MEAMPYCEALDELAAVTDPSSETAAVRRQTSFTNATVTSDWRVGLPLVTGGGVTLRELRPSDAGSLFALLTTEEVSRFISPPPTSVDGFERFIAWTQRQRALGEYACFGIVPEGCETAIGLIQIHSRARGFEIGEWGFAIGSAYWGTGVFVTAAKLALDFSFGTLGVERLEARAALRNGRGNGALQKLGAVQEAILRRSVLIRGEHLDQALWTILRSEWLDAKTIREVRIH